MAMVFRSRQTSASRSLLGEKLTSSTRPIRTSASEMASRCVELDDDLLRCHDHGGRSGSSTSARRTWRIVR